jgi:hypothetical protein
LPNRDAAASLPCAERRLRSVIRRGSLSVRRRLHPNIRRAASSFGQGRNMKRALLLVLVAVIAAGLTFAAISPPIRF